MAYFSNSSEGVVFDEECSDCILGNEPCPIALVQATYNYNACNVPVARAILNDLVRQEKVDNIVFELGYVKYIGCTMKPLLDKLNLNNGQTPVKDSNETNL